MSATSEKVMEELNALLKKPGNYKCADCKIQLYPRWASWSLGVLICIKCAGIHRSFGTHISKVKSIDLDSWSSENILQLIKLDNNERANELIYENKITDQAKDEFNLDDITDLKKFIRLKYVNKKWYTDNAEILNNEILQLPNETESSSSTASINSTTNDSNRDGKQSSKEILSNKSIVTLPTYDRLVSGSVININSISSLNLGLNKLDESLSNSNNETETGQNNPISKKSIYDLYKNSI